MSKKNRRYQEGQVPEAASLEQKGRPVLYFFIQAVFSFLLIQQVTASKFYGAYHAPLQLLAYLMIYSVVFLLFYDFHYRVFSAKTRYGLYAGLGLSVLYMYVISFYPALEMNGDNAAYLSRAQSLIEGKGFRALWLPTEPYESTLKGLGFSLLNIPFILLFGLHNYAGLGSLGVLSVFAGLFFIYKYFKGKTDNDKLFLLLVLVLLYSQIVHFSSIIMTESPSLMLLFIILALAEKELDNERALDGKKVLMIALVAFLCMFLFTVREAFILLLGVIPLYLFIRKKWKEAVLFGLFAGLGLASYLLYSRHLKALNLALNLVEAQDKAFASVSFIQYYADLLWTNLKNFSLRSVYDSMLVITQKIWGDPDRHQYNGVLGNLAVLAVLALAVYDRIKQKVKICLYDLLSLLFIPMIIFFWGSRTDYVVFSRYYFPLIPAVFYYFILGLSFLTRFIRNRKYALYPFLIVASFMLLHSFSMNLPYVYIAKNPYQPAEAHFIRACEWIGENTDPKAVIATRKSTLSFIWASRKSMAYFDDGKYTRYDNFSPEFERDTLEYYKKNSVDYIILDAFSAEAYYKILPVIRNHSAVFKVRFVTPRPETYVLELDKSKL